MIPFLSLSNYFVLKHLLQIDMCSYFPGEKRPYRLSCRGYWDCTSNTPIAKCCGPDEMFDPFKNKCVLDVHDVCDDSCPKRDKIKIDTSGEY